MQKSRRALLQRRASDKSISVKKHFYKLSLSVIIAIWGLVFLLNLWIGYGDSYADESGAKVGEPVRHEKRDQSIARVADTVSNPTCEQLDDIIEDNFANTNELTNKNGNSAEEFGEISHPIGESKHKLSNEYDLSPTDKKTDIESTYSHSEPKLAKGIQRADRVHHVTPPGLDEFKSKAVNLRGKATFGQAGGIIHRMEPGGSEYNYASATKGAKVLASNKEAKGASNVLDKDKDKYLRNPCSAEEKFVVIELSEETLVDTIELANFEHHSSNFKDFDLLSSQVYPTDSWIKLGNFTAGNVKHAQRFALSEPKWARYVKLNLLSHYGSEFYCTLSVVEIYGVDAVERMLEDLISVQNNQFVADERSTETGPSSPEMDTADNDDFHRKILSEVESESESQRISKNILPDPVVNMRPQQAGRMPGDSVLKILMQKVRSLDVNFSVLERYLEELIARYGDIFNDFDDEIAEKDLLLEQFRVQLKELVHDKKVLAKDIGELLSWKSHVSSQLDKLVKDNALLRSEVERVQHDQMDMENKGLVVIFLSFIFGSLAVTKLITDIMLSMLSLSNSGYQFWKHTNFAWLLLLLSSGFIVLILI